DVQLIHVVHAARRRGVERFTEEQEPPGGTKRLGALSTVGGEDSNAPGRERDDRSGQIATVFGELVDLRGGRRRQRSADDQSRLLDTGQPLGQYCCADPW